VAGTLLAPTGLVPLRGLAAAGNATQIRVLPERAAGGCAATVAHAAC
jgi:hypothetical protein